MSILNLHEFPFLSPGKTGWPWTEESKPLPPLMPNGKQWPKICIVTPSYNQGQFLEETIRSVLLQNYPNLEYIIMDGGSTDNSLEIIRKYEPRFTYWVSEKDKGQTDAIARGFERGTGEILAWINSDDILLPDALATVAKQFVKHSDIELLIGGGIYIDSIGKQIRKCYCYPQDYKSMLTLGQFFLQMSCFWKKTALLEVGGLDTSLAFCFDYDLFLKLAKRRDPGGIDMLLSAYRVHDTTKTATIWESVAMPEFYKIRSEHEYWNIPESERQRSFDYYTGVMASIRLRGVLKDIYRDPFYALNQLLLKFRR